MKVLRSNGEVYEGNSKNYIRTQSARSDRRLKTGSIMISGFLFRLKRNI